MRIVAFQKAGGGAIGVRRGDFVIDLSAAAPQLPQTLQGLLVSNALPTAQADAAFFAGTSVKSNFVCAIGYGDETAIFDRLPRLDFDQACSIL
jgi:hypothetical protein